MAHDYQKFNLNFLPVHMFVKSQKEAKKIVKQPTITLSESAKYNNNDQDLRNRIISIHFKE